MILSILQKQKNASPLSFGDLELSDRMWHEQLWIALLVLFPLSLLIGQLSLRLASHSPFSFIRPDIYNMIVRLLVADLIMEGLQQSFTCIPFEEEEEMMELLWQSVGGIGCPLYARTLTVPATAQLYGLRILVMSIGLFLGEGWMAVAITGSIATGKSTVGKLLVDDDEEEDGDTNEDEASNSATASTKRRSIPVIDGGTVIIVDTDKIGHDILLQGTAGNVYSKLVSTFGADNILSDDMDDNDNKGKIPDIDDLDPPIDRTKLGAIIFENHPARRKLNAITHPRIMTKLVQQLTWGLFCTGTDICVADVPLLFEAGFFLRCLFCLTICVTCTPAQQLERLQARNPTLTQQECQARIDSQMDLDKKAALADLVVDNSGENGIDDENLKEQVEALREQLMMRLYGVGLTLFQIVAIMGVSLPVALYLKLYQDAKQQNGGEF